MFVFGVSHSHFCDSLFPPNFCKSFFWRIALNKKTASREHAKEVNWDFPINSMFMVSWGGSLRFSSLALIAYPCKSFAGEPQGPQHSLLHAPIGGGHSSSAIVNKFLTAC